MCARGGESAVACSLCWGPCSHRVRVQLAAFMGVGIDTTARACVLASRFLVTVNVKEEPSAAALAGAAVSLAHKINVRLWLWWLWWLWAVWGAVDLTRVLMPSMFDRLVHRPRRS